MTLPSPPTAKMRRLRRDPARPKEMPSILNADGLDSNSEFTKALGDESLVFNAVDLGFHPQKYWYQTSLTFEQLVTGCFRRKNNANCRFSHKLYIALLIVDAKPEMYPLVGVKWVRDGVFLVDKYIFGRLLGITKFDGALFHSQGNFSAHGFAEVGFHECKNTYSQLVNVQIDHDRTRLMMHPVHDFCKGATEDVIAYSRLSRV